MLDNLEEIVQVIMPNKIHYKGNYVSVWDPNLQFILDELLEIIKDNLIIDPGNKWLLEVQEEWKTALLHVGNNCRDLSLATLIQDELSQKQIVNILNETKRSILSYGQVIPHWKQRQGKRIKNLVRNVHQTEAYWR